LLAEAAAADDAQLEPALELLRKNYHLSVEQVGDALHLDKAAAARLLVRLCRQGRVMFDVEARDYRHRELFEAPADEQRYFPPDRRQELAAAFIAQGQVRVASNNLEETKKTRLLFNPSTGGRIPREVTYRDWRVSGEVGDEKVEIVINDSQRIIFGRCTCPYFAEHLLNQGPCEHILALFKATDGQRIDQPSSAPVEGPVPTAPRREPARWEVDQSEDAVTQ
jgi:hypothetical protein